MKKIIAVGSVLAWAGMASAVLLMEQDFNDSKGAVSWVDRANNKIKWGGNSSSGLNSTEAAPVNGGGCSGSMKGKTISFKPVLPDVESLKSCTFGGWVKAAIGADAATGNSALFGFRSLDKTDRTCGFTLVVGNDRKGMTFVMNGKGVKKIDVPLPEDTWTFIALTFDGTSSTQNNLKVYMSTGAESLTLIAECQVRQDEVRVNGTCFGVGYKDLIGLVDNVRLYGSPMDGSGALTEEEIKVWMQSSDLNESKQEGLKIFHTVGAIQLFNAGFLR